MQAQHGRHARRSELLGNQQVSGNPVLRLTPDLDVAARVALQLLAAQLPDFHGQLLDSGRAQAAPRMPSMVARILFAALLPTAERFRAIRGSRSLRPAAAPGPGDLSGRYATPASPTSSPAAIGSTHGPPTPQGGNRGTPQGRLYRPHGGLSEKRVCGRVSSSAVWFLLSSEYA